MKNNAKVIFSILFPYYFGEVNLYPKKLNSTQKTRLRIYSRVFARRKIATLFLLRRSAIASYRFQAGFRRSLLKDLSVRVSLYLSSLLNTGIAVIGVSTE